MPSPILVCGDSMWDDYWRTDVERISPEAPVLVANVRKTETRHGATSNVAKNIEALGGQARPVFCRSQSSKIRVLARGHQLIRLDFDVHPPEREVAEMESLFTQQLAEPCKTVIFSDYGKGALIHVQALIQEAKAAGAIILVDPKGHDYRKYAGAFLLKPNLEELRAVVGGWVSENHLREKVSNLRQELSVECILLTRASEGMTLFTSEEAYHVPTQAQEVFDVTGAGDTAIAAFAVALEEEISLQEAVHLATKAAGITCQHLGAYAPSRKEVFCD